MNAERFTSATALEAGIIDLRGGLAEVEQTVEKVAPHCNKLFYRQIRQEMLKPVVNSMDYVANHKSLLEYRDKVWKFQDDRGRQLRMAGHPKYKL